MAAAISSEQGRKQNQQHQRAEEIHEHLGQALPGGFRRGAKDQQGMAEQFIQTRARDLRSKKVGHEPGIDALEFADFDDAFDPLEIRLFGADDDAAGGMLVEQFNELLQGGFDKVKLAHDFDAFVGLLFPVPWRIRAISLLAPTRMKRRLYCAWASLLL